MKLRTNAKINLFLRVIGSRPDGYHDIETVFQSVSLADDLTFSFDGSDHIDVSAFSALPSRAGEPLSLEPNLVTVALGSLQDRTKTPLGGHVRIEKRIPVAGGLGGGSANAAGALVAARKWKPSLPGRALADVAASIGSDVAFCLRGGTAVGRGRGEILEPLAEMPRLALVLGISDAALPTASVYGAWRPGGEGGAGSLDRLLRALSEGDPEAAGNGLHNDLEEAAFALMPELRERKQALIAAGACGALLAGSGPTLMAMARDVSHAEAIAGRVRDNFQRVEVVSSSTGCVEPLP